MINILNQGRINKTVIVLGYRCNNYCKFCINADKRDTPPKETEDVLSEIYSAKKRGRDYLEVIGGEQTLRPDIIKIIGYAKSVGFSQIAMATNGRMLSYLSFAREIIKAGLSEVIFSIHGSNANMHDQLTQVPGSFKQLINGIKNVRKIGRCRIGSNTTIVKANYKHLLDIGKLIYRLGIRNAEFIFVDPNQGGAYNDFTKLVPRISEMAPYAKRCLGFGKKRSVSHWHIRYVPLCHFGEYENQISEIYERKLFHTELFAPGYENLNLLESRIQAARVKPSKCKLCRKYEICEGIWVEYYNRYGDDELKPIQ